MSANEEQTPWPNGLRHEIAETVIKNSYSPEGAPEGIKSDANKIANKLYENLVERGISIAKNDTSTHLLCMAAALSELADFCQHYTQINIAEARTYGTTWREVGDVFGVSSRRAMELYNPSTIASRRATDLKRTQKRHERIQKQRNESKN